MVWSTSTRSQRLPNNWHTIRAQVLAAAQHKCQAKTHHKQCEHVATEVDHIKPNDNHNPSNLQALSKTCHKAKTIAETIERNKSRTKKRTPEKHPGLL